MDDDVSFHASIDENATFYAATGRWWGRHDARVGTRDHDRVAAVRRLAGPPPQRLLELGSGYGTTVAAAADAGYEVVGVELTDRQGYAAGVRRESSAGGAVFVRGDFHRVALDGPFDVVCYWNGFGVGTDADQRLLLRRIADEWLRPGGTVLLDVFNPAVWVRWAGERDAGRGADEGGATVALTERHDFDPVANRFIDTWWRDDRPAETFTQSIRCYAPADLALLLEGTGLAIDRIEADGVPVDAATPHATTSPLWEAHEYLVRLRQVARKRRRARATTAESDAG